jgi:hypothetical protein
VAEVLEHVIIEFLGVVNSDFSWDTIAADDALPEKKFLIVAELMFVTGFTSIDFVKYSTATIVMV